MPLTAKQKLDNLTDAPAGLLGRMFRKGSVAAVLLAVFLISGTAWALQPGEYAVFSVTGKSCGHWTAAKEEFSRETPDLRWAIAYSAWVGGYLTAYSLWVEKGSGPVTGVDHAGAIAWLDNYCQENPLKAVSLAAELLIYAIKAK
jgi:hypothetical protein